MSRGASPERGMIHWQAYKQLLLARMRELWREPEVVFWVFFFPVVLALTMGLAFRNRPPEKILVAVVEHPEASNLASILSGAPSLRARVASRQEAARQFRLGKVSLVVFPGASFRYRYDPTRPDSLLARSLADAALQQAAGRTDPVPTGQEPVTEPGARYIDFLIPGLLGMNLLAGGMWGVGYAVVDMRVKKLLKRLIATPMRRADFLLAIVSSRLLLMLVEAVLLLGLGWAVFDIVVQGSISSVVLLGAAGSLCFAGMGLLVASRAQRVETISGLINLVMLPMFVFSGVFFSADRFPEVVQPLIRLLPLTALNDALRSVILEGAGLAAQSTRVLILAAWGGLSFLLALRRFRWT